ncbi:hypothetical protein N7492_000437 [Penicillium capsulatum]|uniref:Uncharacterized protein n=1 Tax=Penicillium capsulatum TaxID=69766 RepID=A0A9W9IVW5_9EURO|nr:hypothetical protein N7492_000437 [Penicillium capsulatum]KAJ6130501.1 hypothetical protein N7512_003281 [Penicillium capsulatum]
MIGDKMRAHGITAQAFGYAWITAAELEFTFLSISERPIAEGICYRDRARSLRPGISELELRPGTKDCFAMLRDAGLTVWCLTMGNTKRVHGYFERAGVGGSESRVSGWVLHDL